MSVMWNGVIPRNSGFLSNLDLTAVQLQDGWSKRDGVVACLNRHYWNNADSTANSMIVGSWGKKTVVRPESDVDILFRLPDNVYWRYQQRTGTGNRQSELLQEVKGVLGNTYPQTAIKGDGQVAVVPFNTRKIEIVPVFNNRNGGLISCDTNDGGSWKAINPDAEFRSLIAANDNSAGNVTRLIRMIKCWRLNCNVPLSSFQVELLVISFMQGYRYRDHSLFWFDWVVRDFFEWLCRAKPSYDFSPSTNETVWFGTDWHSRAESAWSRAKRACYYEYIDWIGDAGEEWQKIFGSEIPKHV